VETTPHDFVIIGQKDADHLYSPAYAWPPSRVTVRWGATRRWLASIPPRAICRTVGSRITAPRITHKPELLSRRSVTSGICRRDSRYPLTRRVKINGCRGPGRRVAPMSIASIASGGRSQVFRQSSGYFRICPQTTRSSRRDQCEK
jgi:hypothetical protein